MRRSARILSPLALAVFVIVLAAALPAVARGALPSNDPVFSLSYGTDTAQEFTVLAAGGSGSFFAAGYRQSTRGDRDFILVKVRADGTVAWHRAYDRALWDEVPTALSVSPAGVVAVSGDAWKGPGETRGLVLLWSTRGKLLWARQIKPPAEGYAEVADVVADRYGRVFAAGRTWNGTRMTDMEVTAYAQSGTRLWQKTIDGGAGGSDFGRAIALDRAGNVYVGGDVTRPATGSAAALVKYSPGGRRFWLRTYDDGTPRSLHFADLAIRGDHVGACGSVTDFTISKGLVARFDTAGHRRWAYVVGDAFRDTGYSSIAIDAYGHLVVGGYQDFGGGAKGDMLVSRFEPTGERALWDWSYAGPGASWDGVREVAVTSEGQVYAVGSVGNADGTSDGVVVHLRPVFATVWLSRYSAGADERQNSLVLDGRGATVAGLAGDKALVQRFTLEVTP